MSTDLKVTQQELEDRQLLVTIEVPKERVDKALRAAVKKMGKRLRIPGFRPGKAPYAVVIQRLGRQNILEDIADDLGQEVFAEVMGDIDVPAIAQPVLNEVTYDPLTYRIFIPLMPEVDPGPYRELRVPVPEVAEEKVQELVEKEIQRLRESNKTWLPTDRPIEYGDLVTISLKVTVDDEVVLDTEEWDFIPSETEYTMAPDFDAAFIGMQVGEKKTFVADIPEDADSAWAGSTATFEAEIKGVKVLELPELDDEFAQNVSNYDTLEEFKAILAKEARSTLEQAESENYRNQVLKTLREQATLKYAPVQLEDKIDAIEQNRVAYYKRYGIDSKEELLEALGQSEEEFREQLKPEAIADLENELVLDNIAELEQFEISDYELKQYLQHIFEDDPAQFDRLSARVEDEPDYRAFITVLARRERALNLVMAIAKGEEVPAPGEHPLLVEPEPEIEEEKEAAAEMEEVEAETLQPEETTETQTTTVEAESEASPQQENDVEDTLELSDSD